MAKLPYPVIVIPGVTATYLRDDYTLPPDFIWKVLEGSKEFERASLHPDNLRYEAIEPARVRPDQIYEIAYRELIEELRFNLTQKESEPVPVYPFGYDWRQPLKSIEAELALFIDEVIERTKLMRHYDRDGYADDPRVNLIGHSMGGLIIAGYLQSKGANHRAAKIATLAAPFQGSYEAVIKVTTGTANLGTTPPSSREREAARVTPSLYHLVPSFPEALKLPTPWPFGQNLFAPDAWQPSIVKTIEWYVRARGLNRKEPAQQAAAVFAAMLDDARAHRTRLDGFKLSAAKLTADDWLCVVGTDADTRVALELTLRQGAPEFEFHSEDRLNRWRDTNFPVAEWVKTGDGTVPFLGAQPKFLSRENLVCVTPDDYGYWELQDKAATKLGGFHGILPNMNMLHRLIVAHFSGRPDKHGNIWGRTAPGVATGAQRWPVKGLIAK